jgi:hypothetical protein
MSMNRIVPNLPTNICEQPMISLMKAVRNVFPTDALNAKVDETSTGREQDRGQKAKRVPNVHNGQS